MHIIDCVSDIAMNERQHFAYDMVTFVRRLGFLQQIISENQAVLTPA